MKYLQCSYTIEFWINEAIHGRDLNSLVWMPDWKNKLPQKEFENNICATPGAAEREENWIEERCAESWNVIE